VQQLGGSLGGVVASAHVLDECLVPGSVLLFILREGWLGGGARQRRALAGLGGLPRRLRPKAFAASFLQNKLLGL